MSLTQEQKLDKALKELELDTELKAEIISKVFPFINTTVVGDKRSWNQNAGRLLLELHNKLADIRKRYEKLDKTFSQDDQATQEKKE